MGTIYYARNTETKEAYELGKGAWELISKDGFIDSSDISKLQKQITEKVIVYPAWSKETVLNIEYHNMIARALNNLGNRLELVSDLSINNPTYGFNVTGSRYINDRL